MFISVMVLGTAITIGSLVRCNAGTRGGHRLSNYFTFPN